MRIALYLVASVLLGASALRPGFAEDPGSHGANPPDAALPAPSANPPTLGNGNADQAPRQSGDTPANVGSKPSPGAESGTVGRGSKENAGARPEGGAVKAPGTNATTRDTGSRDLQGKDFGPIDTRITVQPHPSHARTAKTPPKFSILPHDWAKLHGAPAVAPKITHPIARNAIGQPVSPGTVGSGHDAFRPGSLGAVVGTPAAAAPGGVASVKAAPGPSPGVASVGRPNATPILPAPPPPSVNRGALNGSGAFRHSSGPGVIGGPVKTAAGLNGTTIQRKR